MEINIKEIRVNGLSLSRHEQIQLQTEVSNRLSGQLLGSRDLLQRSTKQSTPSINELANRISNEVAFEVKSSLQGGANV